MELSQMRQPKAQPMFVERSKTLALTDAISNHRQLLIPRR